MIVGMLMFFLFLVAWHYKAGIMYYFRVATSKNKSLTKEAKYDIRNIEIMSKHDDKVFGIDVSTYQEDIDWQKVNTINDQFPIDFVFIRATMGEKGIDDKFSRNWSKIRNRAILRGAYHYFRPNENSVKQAKNFIRKVQLHPGDLPPVLDIEEHPKQQSMDSLKVGLKRWLDEVEAHYKVKPILYSGDKFYSDFLEKEFANYTLWIANYNFWIENPKEHWAFWQFSEKGSVAGIRGNVDLNIYNGKITELEKLLIPFK
ncbi:glycoside hydrolase family 25 protein [Sphingobacterium ginsenosidimutans]